MVPFLETGSEMVVTRDWGERGMGVGDERLQFHWRKLKKMTLIHNSANVLHAKTGHLRVVKMVKFM